MKRLVMLAVLGACATKGPTATPDAAAQPDAAADAAPMPDASLDLRACSAWQSDLAAKPGKMCSIKMPGGAMAMMGATCTADAAHAGYVSCDDVYFDVFGRTGVLVADAGECAFVQCAYGP